MGALFAHMSANAELKIPSLKITLKFTYQIDTAKSERQISSLNVASRGYDFWFFDPC